MATCVSCGGPLRWDHSTVHDPLYMRECGVCEDCWLEAKGRLDGFQPEEKAALMLLGHNGLTASARVAGVSVAKVREWVARWKASPDTIPDVAVLAAERPKASGLSMLADAADEPRRARGGSPSNAPGGYPPGYDAQAESFVPPHLREDALQEAWAAYLDGKSPRRAVWRLCKNERRLERRTQPLTDRMDRRIVRKF